MRRLCFRLFVVGSVALLLLAPVRPTAAQPVVAPATPSRAEQAAEFDRIIAERDPLVDQFNEQLEKGDPAALPTREKLIPFEKRSYELVEARFPGNTEVHRQLAERLYESINYVALGYKQRKQYAKAADWLDELEQVAVEIYGDDNWRVRECRAQAATMKKVAALPAKGQNAYDIGQTSMDETVAFINSGKFDQALAAAEKAIKNVRHTLGDEHFQMGTCWNNLAMTQDRLGDHDAALENFEKGTRISRKALGAHPSTAMSLVNHGLSHLRYSEYDRAEPVMRAGYDMRTATLGPNDASTCDAAYGLGVVLFNLNRIGDAIPLLAQNARFIEQTRGKEDPELGNVLFYLGQSLTKVGDLQNAAQCLERSVNIRRATYGEEHAETLMALYRLGEVYEAAGEHQKCSAYYEQAAAICRTTLDPNHPFLALVLNDLGVAYHNMQSYAKAQPLFEEALAIRKKALGEEHPLTGISLHNLGMVHRDKGKLDEAEPLLKQARGVAEKTSGADSQQVTDEIYALAGLRHLQKKHDEAEPMYLEAIARTEKALGPAATLGIRSDLASMYESQEKFERSRNQVEMMHKTCVAEYGPTAPITQDLERRLTAIYEKTGDQEKLTALVAQSRQRAHMAQALNQLKQLSLALLNYESTYASFPAAGSTEVDGAPRLSWRVHILPYLGGQDTGDLYAKFRLDEPWDSEHNRKLIAEIPDIYRSPGAETDAGKTVFLAFTGPGSLFGNGAVGAKLRDITDGMSNTLMLVEADPEAAVEWTRPDDWEFDAAQPTAGLGKLRNGKFNVVFADGHTQSLPAQIDAKVFKSVITRNGNEIVELEALESP